MTEGTLAKWLKAEGDMVESGDVIAEIETDKATMEVEAVDEGKLGKILIPEGSEGVPVNTPIAVLLEEGEKASSIVIPTEGGKPKVEESSQTTAVQKPDSLASAKQELRSSVAGSSSAEKSSASAQNDKNRIFASPLAKRMAEEKGIDLAQIKGSGPHGRIVKADIEKGPAVPSARPSAPSRPPSAGPDAKAMADMLGMAYTEAPNNNVRKVVAQRLQESKQTVPHFYLTIDCRIDNLLAARKEINDKAGGEYKLSVNDFIIKACAMALKAYPDANAAWTDDAILKFSKADISVAVATPNGLITPIVKAAEDKGMREISTEVKDLAARAREGKLAPEEFQGGTFTVSNLGMYGIREFGAIINPPQACILAVGAGEQRPVVNNGGIEIATVMSCTLSIDHRAVDGAVGAEYLQIFKQYIENPVSMLV